MSDRQYDQAKMRSFAQNANLYSMVVMIILFHNATSAYAITSLALSGVGKSELAFTTLTYAALQG
jgi:dTDP-4-amino-4,6-dideoxygalactose transaminase